jgi:hypothetical protein
MFVQLLAAVVAIAAPPIPPPASMQMLMAVHARGVQIYRCDAAAKPKPAWVLDHPEADLYREDGTAFGKHRAGPSWTANDGSSISGDGDTPIYRVERPGTVPWLLLQVAARSGSGILETVEFVERYATAGGAAPASDTCDTAHDGRLDSVPYTADYAFFH